MIRKYRIFKLADVSVFRLIWIPLIGIVLQFTVQAQQLPQAEGLDAVRQVCTACHQTNLISRSSGYSR